MARLRDHTPEQIAAAIQDLVPARRVEFLELVERVEEIVPLLPEAEFGITVRSVGVADAGWLVEFASAEQRVAAVDLDCWQDFRFSPSRAFEWIDAMIAAGSETVGRALLELDFEIWILAMKAMGQFSILGMSDDDEPWGGSTLDGMVFWEPHTSESDERIREILTAALEHAPQHYWRLVYGAMSESAAQVEHEAAHWQRGRMEDRGFPERAEAMQVYKPLEAEDAPVIDVGPGRAGDLPQVAGGLIPSPFAGHLVAHALAGLAPARSQEVMAAVLGVANQLAVADKLTLTEADSVARALEKALRGIDRGLLEVSRRQDRPVEAVLDGMAPLDLFRIGVTLDPELRPDTDWLDLLDEEARSDWAVESEAIDPADRTVSDEGRLR